MNHKFAKGWKELNSVQEYIDWGVVIDRTPSRYKTIMDTVEGVFLMVAGLVLVAVISLIPLV